MISNVAILHVLCSRHNTAAPVEIQTPMTSKMDSKQNFGVGSVLELLMLFIFMAIMPCDASCGDF